MSTAGKSPIEDQPRSDSQPSLAPLEEPRRAEGSGSKDLATTDVRKISNVRQWLTLGSLTSLVALTGIISTTKDGFDLARDYIIPGQVAEPRSGEQVDAGSLLDVDTEAETPISLSLRQPQSPLYERSVQELIDLLEYRSNSIASKIEDTEARQKFLSLHAKNIEALKQGKLVLSYEITQEIHSLLYIHVGHAYREERVRTKEVSERIRDFASRGLSERQLRVRALYPAPSIPEDEADQDGR